MELTRIGSNNWSSFASVVFDAYQQNAREVLRIGAIEDGKVCGSLSLSFFTAREQAFVDSLYIVPEFRGQGKGAALLAEAERLAGDKVQVLESEFIGSADDLNGFFTANGYACIDGEPIFDYDIKKLLANKQYATYCKHKLKAITTLTFSDMTTAQKNRVFELLHNNGERNSEDGMAGFSHELSIAIYRGDDMRVPRACLIATESDDLINIAQLYGSGVNNPKFILGAIFGFTEAVKKQGGSGKYKELSMVAAHPGVKKVFELLFGKRLKPTESGLKHAIKFLGM